MTTPPISLRTNVLAAALVMLSALVVLVGPLHATGGDGYQETVWQQSALARWVVLGAAAAALGALAAAAAGQRPVAVGLAWGAVLIALVSVASVGALLLPGAIVVLVLLMRSTPS